MVSSQRGLWLIGIGPGDLGYITERALKIAKKCDKRYLEGYTAVLPDNQERLLENIVGPWERLMRPDIENPVKLLNEARHKLVALMIVGDPMQATTHIDLEARCSEENIDFNIIPGMSAISLAISLSGLQSYRFGRQVTIPFSYGDYLPTSPLEMIYFNKSNDLHSLVLLDLDPSGMGTDLPQPMKPHYAFNQLKLMVKKLTNREDRTGLIDNYSIDDWDSILVSDVGTERQNIVSGSLIDLSNNAEGLIHTIIFPATMSDNEKEAFERRRAE